MQRPSAKNALAGSPVSSSDISVSAHRLLILISSRISMSPEASPSNSFISFLFHESYNRMIWQQEFESEVNLCLSG